MNRNNGYGMPVFRVKADADFQVINRGCNEFEPSVEIEENALLTLREHGTESDCAHIEIEKPDGSISSAWYRIKPQSAAQYHALKDAGNLTF